MLLDHFQAWSTSRAWRLATTFWRAIVVRLHIIIFRLIVIHHGRLQFEDHTLAIFAGVDTQNGATGTNSE